MQSIVDQLPQELFLEIFSFLEPHDDRLDTDIAIVCRLFHQLLNNDHFWLNCLKRAFSSYWNVDYWYNIFEKHLNLCENDKPSNVTIHKCMYMVMKHFPTAFDDYNTFDAILVKQRIEQRKLSDSKLIQLYYRVESTFGAVFMMDDDRMIRSNLPIPKSFDSKLPVWYMEMTMVEPSLCNEFSIGLATDTQLVDSQPGWTKGSVGYHGDDGGVFQSYGAPSFLYEQYETNDTVGLGIWYATKEAFVTKNGIFVGVICKLGSFRDIYLWIGMWRPNGKVLVNFGSQPFKFDITNDLLNVVNGGNSFNQNGVFVLSKQKFDDLDAFIDSDYVMDDNNFEDDEDDDDDDDYIYSGDEDDIDTTDD